MMLNPQPISRDPKVTRRSLIDSLGQPKNEDAWIRFYDTYSNMIWGMAVKAGLTPSEAEEVVQETVISVYNKMPEFTYNPEKGSFKMWLFHLITWRIKDQVRKRKPDSPNWPENFRGSWEPGASSVENIPGPEHLDSVWEEEWRASTLDRAMAALKSQVKATHYQIFDLLVTQQWSVSKVASSLGITSARVYLVKHRLGPLLRREMRRLEESGIA